MSKAQSFRKKNLINMKIFPEPTIIPGYAVVILVALGELIVGGLLYVLLRFACLETDWKPKYRRAPSTPSVSGEAPVPPTTTTSTP